MEQLTVQEINKLKLVNDDVPKLTDIFMGLSTSRLKLVKCAKV